MENLQELYLQHNQLTGEGWYYVHGQTYHRPVLQYFLLGT